MTPDRFQQIEQLFEQACELPEAERIVFLETHCAGDDDLRAEVAALLKFDAAAPAAQIAGAIDRAASTVPPPKLETGEVGLQLGPYLLVRELGHGGMGSVYQAMRADGEFLHTVAIKLVKRGMDNESIQRRFRAERQILATLPHHNIARLLDGGTAPDGRPYLVMEYIDGLPLIEYAMSDNLGVRERIELFRPICRAVDFAHRQHVLHRDLKPGNIMVTSDGVPKLLDFGIAKVLMPEASPSGAFQTDHGMRLLTPEYASPEQLRGQELTPASDVFSLGVTLYHLLSGNKPFASARRNVNEPVPPASQAATDPQGRSTLAGDLDAILARAMHPDPSRRYATAGELESDLGRYLAGLPVEARPSTFLYRAAKWTRRHALPMVAAAGVALGIAAVSFRFWMERRDAVPPEALELCRQAELLARSDIRAAQPGQGLPVPLREATEKFQRAAALAPRYVPAWVGLASTAEFAIDYDTQRASDLGKLAESASLHALQLDPRTAAAHGIQGALKFRAWRFAGAATDFAHALEIEPRRPYMIADLADCLTLTGRSPEAITVLEKGLADPQMTQTSHGGNVRGQVILLASLAAHYRIAKRYTEAAERARQAVQLQGNYAPARLQLGMVLEESGDSAAAEREYLAAFSMRPSDQRTAAALGHLYARQKKQQDAEKMMEHLGRLRREGAAVECSVALIHAGWGNHEVAAAALEAAEQARESSLPHRFTDFRIRPMLVLPRVQAIARRLGISY